MKGSTHLAIGAAIGIGAAAYYPFTLQNAALYITVASFSALSPDLDGPSMLSSHLGKLSRWINLLLIGLGAALLGIVAYQYFYLDHFQLKWASVGIMVFLLGLLVSQGTLRNALVSLVGCGVIYAAWTMEMHWLIGFGVFVAWAPWLKHRGLTHTLWALLAWGAIGYGLEQQLHITGLMNTAFVGYLSHLLTDTITPKGVKWLYPLYNKSFKV
ncbi:metal-dependent hydrolase [Paenibacillus swuensis]|uniref:Metal-dependent hydrolase n=1 Tax=Paenibacillus swuensis TaxID=1178515 RepID=A0A172TEZ9_9BACL|nr:metal-dependent hydrolase [Paenibacillus swuensis]ANE45516.1 metal-dependent hydrolase [Paenibacillus swuensis]